MRHRNHSRAILTFQHLYVWLCGCCLYAAVLGSATVRADSVDLPSVSTEQIYRHCQAAGVEILVAGRHSGSGWFADANGLLVTAAHIFSRRGSRVEILSPQYGRLPAELVAVNRGNDAAILKVSPRPEGYATLPFAAETPRVGEEIFQFGSPLFRPEVLQAGKVARCDTAFEYDGEAIGYVEIIHVSAMMQSGTSGGPWLNHRGEVVGLQSGVMSLDNKPVGIAYLAPADPIRKLLNTLRDADTPTLGVGVDELWQQPADLLKQLPAGTEGLRIARLRENGPAARAGVQTGDIILEADHHQLSRIGDLLRLIRRLQPGNSMTLKILRSPETNQIGRTVVLGRAEDALGSPAKDEKPES